MNPLANQKGIALVTALMLTLISLTITMFLMYMVTMGTKMSGANKRYKTALDASYGASEIVSKDLIHAMFSNLSTPTIPLQQLDSTNKLNMVSIGDTILREKLTRPASQWSNIPSKSYDPKEAPDITLTLNSAGTAPYTVYAKIVETDCSDKRPYPAGKCTGSDLSGVYGLEDGASVTGIGSGGGLTPTARPAQYRIEIRSEQSTNARERSNLSILYSY